jgi:hypothetical protein
MGVFERPLMAKSRCTGKEAFLKADIQEGNSFAKEFSSWTSFQKTPTRLR